MTTALALAAVLLAAVNLRPAVTSVGPVLAEIRSDLAMSGTVAGLLAAAPVACFAVFGPAAPWLSRRFGATGVIAVGSAVLTVGLVLRPLAPGSAVFLVTTTATLAGIAVVNVLLPVVVKRRFPERVGMVTGAYSMALNLGASAAAALTAPLTAAAGHWRAGIGAWAVLAAAAVPPWLLLLRQRASVEPPPAAGGGLARDRTSWALAVYFGLQASAAFVVIGFLPQMFRDAGLSARTAGALFAVTSVLGVPLSFALAAVAGRLRRQSGLAVALGLCGLVAYVGLWAAPAAGRWCWVVLLGVANCSFPLALTMIGMRGQDSATVARLSAFAQSVGYLLSIPGPIVVGALYERTGGWHWPLTFLVLLMLPQLVAGFRAGSDGNAGR